MITLELGTIGAGTASFMLNQDPHLSGTFVTIAGFEILTHALWRRDALIADEHRVSVTLRSPVVQRDEHESSVTTIKTEEIFQSSIRELKSVADPV